MIQFSVPYWYLGIAALVAAAYTAALYHKNKKDGLDRVWRHILASIRFLSVFLLCVLLMSPLAKGEKEFIEKPVCYIAVDDSRSMRAALNPRYREQKDDDSLAFIPSGFAQETQNHIDRLARNLSDNFQIERLSFGQEIRSGAEALSLNYEQEASDYAQAFDFIAGKHPDRKAVCILVSDGQANRGRNPVPAYRSCPFPLYTVGIGDTISYPDIYIDDCRFNPYTFLNNRFPVEIRLGQQQAPKALSRLSLSENGKILHQQTIDFSKTENVVQWELEATESGIHRYTLRLETIGQEKNTENNLKEIVIRVLDNHQKILIIGNNPHPDLSCLHQSLSLQEKYQAEVVLAKDLPRKFPQASALQAYDLFILHGLPSRSFPLDEYREWLETKPCWYVISPSTTLERIGKTRIGLEIQAKSEAWNEAQASVNPAFSLFAIEAEEARSIGRWPPLWTPFADYQSAGNGRIPLYQNILGINTENPLLWISPPSNRSCAVLCGHGLWRWRMADYRNEGNTGIFDRLIDHCAALLSEVKPDENLIVRCPDLLRNTEALHVSASLYNPDFEKVRSARLRMYLRQEENGQEYVFEFLPQGEDYFLDAGFLPAGNYTYRVEARNGEESYATDGSLCIVRSQWENLQLPTRLELLQSLALSSGGKSYYAGSAYEARPGIWEELEQEISNRRELKPEISYRETYLPFLESPWLLAIILFLFCFEYFARKRFGNL